MPPHHRRIGILLAAGRGRRMGGTKQLAVVQTAAGPKPLIAAAYDAIRPICDDMIVVLGHEADDVAAALGDRPFTRVLSDSEAPMFASIRAGLCAAQLIDSAAIAVLHPADHPAIAPKTLTALTARSLQRPGLAIIPQFNDRGGHPALIPPAVIATLLAIDCPTGLGDFWLDHPELCERMPIDDVSVIRDIDQPSDLVE